MIELILISFGKVSSLQSIQDKLATHQEVVFFFNYAIFLSLDILKQVAHKKKLVETFLDITHKIQSAQCILSTDYESPGSLRSSNDNKVHSKRELLIR